MNADGLSRQIAVVKKFLGAPGCLGSELVAGYEGEGVMLKYSSEAEAKEACKKAGGYVRDDHHYAVVDDVEVFFKKA